MLLVLGPAAIEPAMLAGVAAGSVVEAMVKHRPMTDGEFAFADRVFLGQVPRHRVILTNMLGFGSRPFTMPSIGDTILVNLGAASPIPSATTASATPTTPTTRTAKRPASCSSTS
ncbi:MAG TPA: hypothetical protein VGR26_13700 [Acidimicrobiales bacterium]|nr:hypothetical protein [Acidimicrobiales bacterium]